MNDCNAHYSNETARHHKKKKTYDFFIQVYSKPEMEMNCSWFFLVFKTDFENKLKIGFLQIAFVQK